MLKVLIVDDEFLIRVGVKSCIEWEKYGFEVVGLAEDGVKALKMIETLKPDIVLTDIKMPNMDGLELIERTKSNYPNVKMIVLSCYNEIDYVKRAIKLGAEDYILKLSMEREALLDVLIKTGESVMNEKNKEDRVDSVKREPRLNKNILKEDLLKKYISGAIHFEELQSEFKSLGVDMDCRKAAILCCGIDDYANAPMKSRMENKHLLKFAFINILEETMSKFYRGEIAEIDSGEYLIFLGFDKVLSEVAVRKEVEEFCRKVNAALKKFLNITVSFGVVEKMEDEISIRKGYQDACEALEHRFYYGRESIIFFSEISRFSEKAVFIEMEEEKLLIGYLENLDRDGVKTVIGRFVDNLHISRFYSPYKVRMAMVEVLHSLLKTAKRYNFDMEFITKNYPLHPVDVLMNSETIIDIRNWFEEFIDKLVDYMTFTRSNEVRHEIARVKSYILEHLDEDITLDKAAKISNISKCHFSTVFKKETGVSFTDYTNRLKMEKAKELLLTYGMKTYEVANKVGISDEAYFSKLFKKYNGVSPSRLKQKLD